jgi:predicted MFS family arabinose efflux permease
MLLLFPVGGIIADRVNKRNIMVILDFSTAILIFLFLLLIGKIDIIPLAAITLIILYGIQGAYQPAVQASIPFLVDQEHIMQGNSVINLITSVSAMAGSVIGGILFSIFGLMPILYGSIACFFASAVLEIFIHIPFEKKETKGNIFATGFNDLKESFNFMFKEREVLWKISLVYACINLFLTSLILIGAPVLITQYLGFEPDIANRLYGYMQGTIAAGAIVGGLLAGFLSKKLKSRASPFLIMGCSLSIFLIGFVLQASSQAMAIYIVLMIGASLLVLLSTLLQVQVITYLQILTPQNLIGKIISCFICICMCSIPLGQFIYGIVFENIGRNVYMPFSVAALIMMTISMFSRSLFFGIDGLIEEQKKKTDVAEQ